MTATAPLFTELYVDGTWVTGSAAARIEVVNPADGSTITTISDATVADCLRAVDAAAAAQEGWREAAPRARAEILRRAWEIMHAEREELAGLIVLENGKAMADALGEVDYAAEFFRWYAEEAVRIAGDYRLAPGGDKRIVVTREPIGVALLITPWNFPAAMATRKIGPALAAGCPVVLKPATETPLTAAAVVDVLARAGVPAGVVNLVTPAKPGPAVEAMLGHRAVRKLSFTGSTEVGRILLRQAADRVVSCSMELGGNAALVVLPDADVELAVAGALVAKMRNGGAACTAANRFYVHRSLVADFSRQLAAAMAAMPLGDGRVLEHQVGALVSPEERDKVAALVRATVDEGATVLTGGTTPGGEGAFYPPTVLVDVPQDAQIIGHEIFGPVAPIITYDEVDEAVAWSNSTEMGLAAYVFGPLDEAIRVSGRLRAGMVAINRGILSDPAAPFGGVRQSGLGREGGFEGIAEYLEEKYLAVPL